MPAPGPTLGDHLKGWHVERKRDPMVESKMRIERVRAFTSTTAAGGDGDRAWLGHRIAAPLSSAGFNTSAFSAVDRADTAEDQCLVEILCGDGTRGIGWARGGLATAWTIDRALAPLLFHRDPTQLEALYDQLLAFGSRYGSLGQFLPAIGAVDCALWDIRPSGPGCRRTA